MSAKIQGFLGQYYPGLTSLSGIQLLIFLIVSGLTFLFFAGYLIQGTMVSQRVV